MKIFERPKYIHDKNSDHVLIAKCPDIWLEHFRNFKQFTYDQYLTFYILDV